MIRRLVAICFSAVLFAASEAFAAAPNIDTGRQLFVDDVLVDHLDGLVRRYHYPVKYAGNPVLKAETKFELPSPPLNRVALPKGGGMWWNAKAGVFQLWYEVGWCGVIHYATSPDGIVWTRPALDPETGSNKVSPPGRTVDSWSVVKDPHGTDPQTRYKLYVQPGGQDTDGYASVSPDGIHWSRWGSGKWDMGYVQPLSNLCVIMGDKLRFYYGAFGGDETKKWTRGTPRVSNRLGMYDNGAMGFAELRRDGFVSLHADGTGTLSTKPIVFGGEWLFVNAACPKGELRVEVQDRQGQPIAPFTFANCRPVAADRVKAPITWNGADSLAALRGREVRFCFRVRQGDLYAFWVSKWRTGESGGYLAGGGPGYAGLIDLPGGSL